MTFRIALSGLNAAQADLSATGNNIANANTTGFKGSRAEFGDVFQATALGLSSSSTGGGVRVERVAQNFAQGTVNVTNNSLDMAISGEGFFTLSNGGALSYSRAGAFSTDRNGYVVNASGARLQVYAPLAGGTGFNTGGLSDLQLSTADNPPSATKNLQVKLNLPSNASVPATAVFDSTDPTSYNQIAPTTIYDSLGSAHTATLYFVKNAAANTWDLHAKVDGTDLPGSTQLVYSNAGQLVTPAGGAVTLPAFTPTNGAAPLTLNLGMATTTQFGDSYSINALSQDGYTTGRLVSIEVSDAGVVQARYTNGQSNPIGEVALTSFANAGGLQQLGNTSWGETFASGQAIRGVAGTGSLGQIQSGALEASNVDLTEQLANMITAQRNFQANSQMIQTQDQITQTIIQLR